MSSRTVTAVLDAPKEQVFDYLSQVVNLPEWASEFARKLRYEDGKEGGCPRSRRTLNGGPPASSAPVGSVRGANQVREDRRNRRGEGTRYQGRHDPAGDGESAATAHPGGAGRARWRSERGFARTQRRRRARRRARVDGARGRRGRRRQGQAQRRSRRGPARPRGRVDDVGRPA